MPQPKAHKYNSILRLSKAKPWINKYNGKRLYNGYAKHFGVTKLCAVQELEMLGYEFPAELKENLKQSEENKRIRREQLKAKKEESLIDSVDTFAYIVGYTSGGAPYGITWEEMNEIESNDDYHNQDNGLEENELPF